MAIDRFTGGRDRADALARLMRKPGLVQVALGASPRYLLPLALMYDYDLDTGAPRDRYKICSTFLRAAARESSLHGSPCFSGSCPTRTECDASVTICPSGLWGFRHRIGVPLSAGSLDLEAPTEILWEDQLRITAARSTDPAFRLWRAHEQKLKTVFGNASWECAESNNEALRLLKERNSHMVYFYCHGGTSGNIPYLQM